MNQKWTETLIEKATDYLVDQIEEKSQCGEWGVLPSWADCKVMVGKIIDILADIEAPGPGPRIGPKQ